MVDAERRLLANALRDTSNQQFVLLSDSCVPLRSFEYIYNYLMHSNLSYVDCFDDPGQHGAGRHMNHMLPEIPKKDFRKGAQWFTMKRQHAVATMADSLYYSKFRDYCGPGIENNKNCIADEHYLPTFFHVINHFQLKKTIKLSAFFIFMLYIFGCRCLIPVALLTGL
jgi:hypothetical protein